MLYANAALRRKESEHEVSCCVIEKVITLDIVVFDYFKKHLLSDFDFIRDNEEVMYKENDGTAHCLLVIGEGNEDGILVESEGYAYARYSAYLPNALIYLTANMEEAEALGFSSISGNNEVLELGQKM